MAEEREQLPVLGRGFHREVARDAVGAVQVLEAAAALVGEVDQENVPK